MASRSLFPVVKGSGATSLAGVCHEYEKCNPLIIIFCVKLFLFLTRTAYLLGLFGPGGQTAAAPPQEGEKAKEAKKKDQ